MRTDAQLVQLARTDPDALAELFERHAGAVHAWLRRRVPDAIAVELTAETFAQAALSLRRFRDEADGSALPWLYGIARNLLRRSLERDRIESAARRRLGLGAGSPDLELERVEERVDAGRVRPALVDALAALPAGQRDALALRVLDELPYDRVAATLGCSEVAARIRVTRALGSLSRRLKGTTP